MIQEYANRLREVFDPEYLYLVFLYVRLCILDFIDFYYKYLILSLPAHMFGAPVIKISQVYNPEGDSSDDDVVDEMREYCLFISQLLFVFKTNEVPPTMTTRVLSGLQINPLLDDKGRFFISHIQRYYPTLDTIVIQYTKIPAIDSLEFSEESVEIDPSCKHVKVIDVTKRYDIRNDKSCKFGVVL